MRTIILLALLTMAVILMGCRKTPADEKELDQELKSLLMEASGSQGISYFELPESDDYSNIPQDPRNPITKEKVALGKLLFHETNLAINPKIEGSKYTYSCATCHHAPGGFQACRPQGISEGGIGFGLHGEGRMLDEDYPLDSIDVQPLRTPSILNSAYQEAQLWNGQFGSFGINEGTESQWFEGTPREFNELGYLGVEIQARAGIKVHRQGIDPEFIKNSDYKQLFDASFPDLPEEERYTSLSAALAMAAYERVVLANQSPFQKWLKGNTNAMTDKHKEGAILFFGKANCVSCHTGPALNSMAFYGLGMSDLDAPGVYGGVEEADRKGRGGFTGNPDDDFKFKVPQLYSLRYSPFYGHGGSFRSLYDIVNYKNKAVKENTDVPDSQIADEFKPLGLTDEEVRLIAEFLEYALDDPNLHRYEPQFLPSGNCFPNNDPLSQSDLGCNTLANK